MAECMGVGEAPMCRRRAINDSYWTVVPHSLRPHSARQRQLEARLRRGGHGAAASASAASARCSRAVWRMRWLRTAASYQLKLSSGLLAKRPSVRRASDLLLVVVQKDVAFFAFDQRQHVDVLRHGVASPGADGGRPCRGARAARRSARPSLTAHIGELASDTRTRASPAPPLAASVSVTCK